MKAIHSRLWQQLLQDILGPKILATKYQKIIIANMEHEKILSINFIFGIFSSYALKTIIKLS